MAAHRAAITFLGYAATANQRNQKEDLESVANRYFLNLPSGFKRIAPPLFFWIT